MSQVQVFVGQAASWDAIISQMSFDAIAQRFYAIVGATGFSG